ncbi:DegT/DnrJ/EryC1/StrS aminotransferase family protein [compost metagenome]
MGKRYGELLAGLPGVQLPVAKTDYAENIYWIFGLLLDEDLEMDAEGAMKLLAEKGIGTRPFFCPMHMQPVLQRMGLFSGESYPVAERLYRKGFYIPSGLGLTEVQLKTVAEAVWEVLG